MWPTDKALVMTHDGFRISNWGLPSPWDGKPIVNARAETLDQKPTFKPLLEQRCVAPASAYFEWRHEGRKKLKNRIMLENDDLFAMAGLTDGTHFTIITCKPAASIEHIHNRMPVLLTPEGAEGWLNPQPRFSGVAHLLVPYQGSSLTYIEDTPEPAPQGNLFGS